jgi:hypothetical protein
MIEGALTMSPDSDWSGNQTFPASAGDCREPALATVGNVLHAVWTQNKTLHHVYLAGGKWSEPKAIGVGGQTSLASTPDGKLHNAFAAEMLGNIEIYACTWDGAKWSLPQVVSRTTGNSMYPALAAGPDGSLHVAWADTTPGYSTIYYGHHEGAGWTSTPIPNGRGSYPTIVVGRSSEVYVAWQSRLADTARFEVFCSIYSGGTWSLPEDVSDTAQQHSIYSRLAVNSGGACHLVWQEDRGDGFAIRHADRRPNGWAQPDDVSAGNADCRLPRIMANRQGHMQTVWAEGPVLKHRVRPPDYDAAWWTVETASESCAALSDLDMTISADGQLHILWCGYTQADIRRLFYIHRGPVFKHTSFVPIISR